jgi:hypothetical protein
VGGINGACRLRGTNEEARKIDQYVFFHLTLLSK